jgi:hypothetical protein
VTTAVLSKALFKMLFSTEAYIFWVKEIKYQFVRFLLESEREGHL